MNTRSSHAREKKPGLKTGTKNVVGSKPVVAQAAKSSSPVAPLMGPATFRYLASWING